MNQLSGFPRQAEPGGDFECSAFDGLRDGGEVVFVDAGGRAGDADASGNLAICIENGGADATRPGDGLFVVERIAESSNLRQVFAQPRDTSDGSRRRIFKSQGE